jgi:hypothetical protein
MRLLVLLLLCALAGCSTTGLFESADYFFEERLLLREDGTFSYEYWTDDGSCISLSAGGTWRRVDANTIETLREHCISPGSSCDKLPAIQSWRVSLGRLHRSGSRPFRHKSGVASPWTICEPSANQSFERTRPAAASGFAGQQLWRAAQLQIR